MAFITRVRVINIINRSGLLSGKQVGQCNVGFRNIYSQNTKPPDLPPRPAPYDYKRKGFKLYHYLIDSTTKRINENSKIIVVEGPLAAGKSALAKRMAQEFEMLYLPEANLDMININEYGYDLRQLDEQLPESCRSFDVDNFMRNPKNRLVGCFQIKQYSVRFAQYIDALAHLLSTGQGVVLDRCCYSDFVFVEAMYNQGYISKGVKSVYYDIRGNSIQELLRPHLVIYLDVPVPKVIENIKRRKISYESNSPVVNPKYLAAMELAYKQKYLKEICKHSELLIYDWSAGGDPDIVIEDIERIDFNRYDNQDTQMKDWSDMDLEDDWAVARNYYSDHKGLLMEYLHVPRYDVPELVTDGEDVFESTKVLDNAPGNYYEFGYDPAMGEATLMKTKSTRDTLPLRERRIPQ